MHEFEARRPITSRGLMKAIRVHGSSAVLRLRNLEDAPTPKPSDGEVLVRIHALGVNPSFSVSIPQALKKDIMAENALSACDKPNCRAIRDGVTPALNAARTVLT